MSLAEFINTWMVTVGLDDEAPGSSAKISFPRNAGTIQDFQAIVDEWAPDAGNGRILVGN